MLSLSTTSVTISINMAKNNYHHKDLKEKLITIGLELLVNEGLEKFSMRKLATLCKVSHNAPYRHFKTKDDLIESIFNRAILYFQESLISALNIYPGNPEKQLIELGINYVSFFVENPLYHTLFFNSELKGKLYIKNGEFKYNEAHLFNLLDNCVQEFLKKNNKKAEYNPIIVLEFWSTVHGLTSFIATKKVIFEDGYVNYLKPIMTRLVSYLNL